MKAVFGASALVALGFAWYQIRQVDQSNKALIASNELARQVNIEAVRSRVQVALEASRIVQKDRGASATGTLYIVVRNIGVSPASDVRLRVSPPFTSLEKFFKPGMMSGHFAEVNETFNGEVHFPTLNPDNSYTWFLGRVPELFQDGSGIPRRGEVASEYTGTASPEPFRETLFLTSMSRSASSCPSTHSCESAKMMHIEYHTGFSTLNPSTESAASFPAQRTLDSPHAYAEHRPLPRCGPDA